MPRKRRVAVTGLNIRAHPHTRNIYLELLEAAFELRMPVPYRGDQRLLMNQISKAPQDNQIRATFARFTQIDVRGDWFDTLRLDKAADADLKQIHIPQHLRPNFVSFAFLFDLKSHTMVVEAHNKDANLSPGLTKRALAYLLDRNEITKRFGPIEVDVIADRAKVQRILRMPQLRKLTIAISRPNPDDLGEVEAEVQRRMKEQGAKEYEETLTAVPGLKLTPNKKTTNLALVASKNGKVEGEGRDKQGNPIKESSLEFPKVVHVRYNPDDLSEQQAFERAVIEFLDREKQ